MTPTKPLSARQSRILDFVRAYHARHGLAPGVRDIMAGAEISSCSVVSYNLRKLEEAGHLRLLGDRARGIVLPEAPAASAQDLRALLEDHADGLDALAEEVYQLDADTLRHALTIRAAGLRDALRATGASA